MLPKFKWLIFIFVIHSSSAICQQPQNDSFAIIKQAKHDSKTFKLEKSVWKKYKHSLPLTSDYFKPNALSVNNPALLNDSVYVAAYRIEAHKKNNKRHTVAHYFLLGGEIAASVYAALIIAILIFIAPDMG